MIWNSIAAMTAFDVLIVAAISWCAAGHLRKRAGEAGIGSRRGTVSTVTGLSVIAIFFIADLSTMHVLPLFVSRADSMAAMRYLHLEISWVALLFGVGFLAAGYHSFRGATLSLLTELANARRDLTEELERQRLLIDSSPDAILVGQEGMIALANRAAVELFGTPLSASGRSTPCAGARNAMRWPLPAPTTASGTGTS